jgi:hypothetical protein
MLKEDHVLRSKILNKTCLNQQYIITYEVTQFLDFIRHLVFLEQNNISENEFGF